MKYIFFILCSLILLIPKVQSAEPTYFYSPGIKLGYQLGEKGGFIYGFELSLTALDHGYPIAGVVTNIDFFKGNTKLHFGAELSAGIIGIDIGPSYYFTESGNYFGFTLGLYSLVFVMPYYETSRFYNVNSSFTVNQFGTYLKMPFSIDGRKLYNFAH